MILSTGGSAIGQALTYPIDSSLMAVASFFLVGLVIDLYDISLPRGDSVGVGGALFAASLIVLGPVYAIPLAASCALTAHLVRRGIQAPGRLLAVLMSRLVGLSAAALVLSTFPARTPEFVVLAVVPPMYLLAELAVAQATVSAMTSRPFIRLLSGNLRAQAPVLAAQWSASALLLLTYSGMGAWSLIPSAALLLLMRQSYALFLEIREAYRTTVEVLVEAAEGQDIRRTGHAERTAACARNIAMRMGLGAAEVERISYAALLHDLGELAEEGGESRPATRKAGSSAVIEDVEFFSGVLPILRICEGQELEELATEEDQLAALLVTLASDIDAAEYVEVGLAHASGAVGTVASRVPRRVTARAVGAALELGYRTPAVG